MSTYVRHISGQGETFEVVDMGYYSWATKPNPCMSSYYLPKSEYFPCDPPPHEVWTDVTSDCGVWDGRLLYRPGNGDIIPIFSSVREVERETLVIRDGFRLQKIAHGNRWAFAIEHQS